MWDPHVNLSSSPSFYFIHRRSARPTHLVPSVHDPPSRGAQPLLPSATAHASHTGAGTGTGEPLLLPPTSPSLPAQAQLARGILAGAAGQRPRGPRRPDRAGVGARLLSFLLLQLAPPYLSVSGSTSFLDGDAGDGDAEAVPSASGGPVVAKSPVGRILGTTASTGRRRERGGRIQRDSGVPSSGGGRSR
jgi:hypothetical protein